MTAAALDLPVADRPDDATVLDEPEQTARFTRWERRGGGSEGTRTAVSALLLQGTWCAACGGPIERALREVDGVLEAAVDARALRASVRWDPSRTRPSALVQAVRRAGYDALPDTAVDARALRRRESRQALWRLFVAGFCAMQVMMLATPVYVAGPDGMAGDLRRLLDWGSWVLTLPVMLFSAAPFFRGSWAALRARRIGMDVPVALGIAVAFAASTGAAFDPGGVFGHEVWFDSLTMFVAFLLGGRWLETLARHRAAAALESAAGRLPERVQRVRADGSLEAVAPSALRPGDIVRVAVGEAFAADGELVAGRTEADESLLSGESRPVPKPEGSTLVAGSLNLGRPVDLRVTRVGADTRYEGIVALVREAASSRPALARSADRWAGPFLWTVLALAAAGAAAWSVIDPARAVGVAVSVLIVTCPCALSLAVPSALLAAASSSARRGLLLRRLDALETLARVQRVFVDKTGTLSEARLHCVEVVRFGTLEGRLVRRTAAALAGWSQHPLSRALHRDFAEGEVVLHGVAETTGAGLEARDGDGRVWRLGAAAWCGANETARERPCVWVACDGRPAARFDFDERAREDTAQALDALRRDGVRLTLLSGDAPERVDRLGAALGIDDRHGGLAPEDKLRLLKQAQARGEVVAMVGDGLNDAPVLAQADVSIAMGEGAAVARDSADAVLLGDTLGAVAHARALARRTMRVVRQNLAWAAAYNLACVPLALMGWLPPWAAGLGMAASSLLVVLNSLRLARA
jgi:Cu2+-exporting ATPase